MCLFSMHRLPAWAPLFLLLALPARASASSGPGAPLETAAPASAARLPTSLALADRLDRLVAPVAEQAAVGLCVCSLDRGDELYTRNADAAFTPASNQKLLVAAAALDALGPGFCFTTRVLALGPHHGATLAGDLVLRGGGDPTLTTERLAALADGVAAAGIRRVTGRVRGTVRSSTRSGSASAGPGTTSRSITPRLSAG